MALDVSCLLICNKCCILERNTCGLDSAKLVLHFEQQMGEETGATISVAAGGHTSFDRIDNEMTMIYQGNSATFTPDSFMPSGDLQRLKQLMFLYTYAHSFTIDWITVTCWSAFQNTWSTVFSRFYDRLRDLLFIEVILSFYSPWRWSWCRLNCTDWLACSHRLLKSWCHIEQVFTWTGSSIRVNTIHESLCTFWLLKDALAWGLHLMNSAPIWNENNLGKGLPYLWSYFLELPEATTYEIILTLKAFRDQLLFRVATGKKTLRALLRCWWHN